MSKSKAPPEEDFGNVTFIVNAPQLAVMDDVAALVEMGLLELDGPIGDLDTHVDLTPRGRAVCAAEDKGDEETAAAIARGDPVLQVVVI